MTNELSIKRVLADCPGCERKQATDVLASFDLPYDDGNTSGNTSYRVIQCCTCSHVHFPTVDTFSEDVSYHRDPDGEEVPTYNETLRYFPPIPKRIRPEWMECFVLDNPTLDRLLDEAYGALTYGFTVSAAVALRTIFDAATEHLNIDPALSFDEKLDALERQHGIDAQQRAILNVLTNAGSAAAHRGFNPSAELLETMFRMMEEFLHKIFVTAAEQQALAKRVAELSAQIPLRPKRRP
jgi:hypothetical protein